LIDLIATISLTAASEGEKTHRSVDLLGRVYEYFLTRFASAEGKNGGQFYTPSCVVRCLVEMLAPYKGRIYDPCCGSGGMFVQSEKFVEAHGGRLGDISIYGQESNATTRRLAVMNLAIRGIEADFGPEQADTFRRDLHPDLRADYVLANPPFNAYHNRAISTMEVIEELIKLAKEMDAATKRGVDLGLTDDEVAFYDALCSEPFRRHRHGRRQTQSHRRRIDHQSQTKRDHRLDAARKRPRPDQGDGEAHPE